MPSDVRVERVEVANELRKRPRATGQRDDDLRFARAPRGGAIAFSRRMLARHNCRLTATRVRLKHGLRDPRSMRQAVREMGSDYYGKVAKSAATMLARWNGGVVRVRELTVSHRTLSIVVFRDYATLARENLRFAADPVWMRGPFEWTPAVLQIDVMAAVDTPAAAFTHADRLFRLRDPIGFELLCSSLEVAENVNLA